VSTTCCHIEVIELNLSKVGKENDNYIFVVTKKETVTVQICEVTRVEHILSACAFFGNKLMA
jgi:hypothetical protein